MPHKRTLLTLAAGVLVLGGLASPAAAADRDGSLGEATVLSGCTVPPCGALTNRSSSYIPVRWSNDNDGWTYSSVAPGTTKGGYFNDRIDVDYYQVKTGCRATRNGWITWEGPGWYKISSSETVTVNGYICSGGSET